jgi:hypothetical protein
MGPGWGLGHEAFEIVKRLLRLCRPLEVVDFP